MAGEIIVPLDGTRFAEAALPWAIRLAHRDGRPITLVTAYEPYPGLSDSILEWELARQAELDRYLKEVAKRVEGATSVPVTVVQRDESPGRALTSLPREIEAGVVVMATHAAGPLSRFWLGSVGDSVVRKGGVPVFLVRADEEDEVEVEFQPAPAVTRILVPLDGSEMAESALRKSILMGGDSSVEILLAYVLGLPQRLRGDASSDLSQEMVIAETEAAGDYLDGVAARIAPWGAEVTTIVWEQTPPWAGIAALAALRDVDLIAMATHGRGRALRLVTGSVADHVIRTADVPVLLFPPSRVELEKQGIEQLAGQVVGM